MNNFKDFGIKTTISKFIGEKIPIKKVIGHEIQVLDFKIAPSVKKPGTDLLTLQIEKSGDKRVIFTGSKVLMDQIKQVPKSEFPFNTVINGDQDYFEFT
jgi:hypothetical protein